MTKKILIIYGKIGNGHYSAATNCAETIKNLYGDKVEIHMVDYFEYLNKNIDKAIRKGYVTLMRYSPFIFKMGFSISDNPKNTKAMNALSSIVFQYIEKLIQEIKPSIIITSWPTFDMSKFRKNIKLVSIVTDCGDVHHSWIGSNPDYFIVANSDTKKSFIRRGVPEHKIKELGFPVNMDFYRYKKQEPHNVFTVLISAGDRKYKRIIDMVKHLNYYGENIRINVITGKNKRLKKRLLKLPLKNNIVILDWVYDMYKHMKESDIIVAKAGGATVQECIAAQTPVILYDTYPKIEEGNVSHISENKLGMDMIKNKPLEIVAEIVSLSHPKSGEYKLLKKNITSYSKPNSTLHIAKFIGKLIGLEN